MVGGLAAWSIIGELTAADAPPADDSLETWFQRSNGVYSVFEAALAGDLDVLKQRLAEGAPVNGKNSLGDTPLHLAAEAGHAALVRRLLSAGADPLAKDAAGRIPSDRAKSADCAEPCRRQEHIRRSEISLFPPVAADDCDALQQALDRGLNPNALSEDCSLTLLGAAVQAGALKTARVLLQAGADATCTLPSGLSLLHLAAQRGRTEMIPLLLAAGADPMARGRNGALPIHEAIWYGRTEAALALIQAYKAQRFNPDGRGNDFPVRMAIWRGNTRVVQGFLEAGLNPNDRDFSSEPLLIHAVRQNRADIVRLLLSAGADKNAADSSGKCAADYASGPIADLLK